MNVGIHTAVIAAPDIIISSMLKFILPKPFIIVRITTRVIRIIVALG